MDSTLLAALVGAVVAGVAALFLPARIAALPEPDPDPEPTPEELEAKAARRKAAEERAAQRGKTLKERVPEPPKEPYAELAARPGLGARLALAAALSAAVVGLALGWDWALLFWVPLVPIGVGLAFIDWNTRLLPVDLVYPAYAVALVGVVVAGLLSHDPPSIVRALVAGLVVALFYFVLFFIYPSGLGFGDVRLAGVLGLALGYLGWGEVWVGIYAGFVLGGLIGLALRLTKVVRQRHVPFGPFMLLGALAGVVWGDPIWSSLVGG